MAGERCHVNESYLLSNPSESERDGVGMRLGTTVITDAFPPRLCLGPQELRCYNIDKQDPTREARIGERASLVVTFIIPDAIPSTLRGLTDTGSGVSISIFLQCLQSIGCAHGNPSSTFTLQTEKPSGH